MNFEIGHFIHFLVKPMKTFLERNPESLQSTIIYRRLLLTNIYQLFGKRLSRITLLGKN